MEIAGSPGGTVVSSVGLQYQHGGSKGPLGDCGGTWSTVGASRGDFDCYNTSMHIIGGPGGTVVSLVGATALA